MFARLATLAVSVAALAAVAAAVPGSIEARQTSECNTGTLQCCDTVGTASDPSVVDELGLLGVVLGPVDGLIGLTCTPISILAIAGNSCTQQPVCCTGNQFNGLVNVGCTPINLNL